MRAPIARIAALRCAGMQSPICARSPATGPYDKSVMLEGRMLASGREEMCGGCGHEDLGLPAKGVHGWDTQGELHRGIAICIPM